MSRSAPQRVVIEFDDGWRAETRFESLPESLRGELLRQPFASRPSPKPEQEKFLLLEWDDGWKEVVEVDPACDAILRYYVVSRPDDVGRLSVGRPDGYPELTEIVRRPLGLSKITFVDTFQTFQLSPEQSKREGKKIEHFFKLVKQGDAVTDEVEAFRQAAASEGIDPRALRSQDPTALREPYERIRRRMGLRAGWRQQDVWSFVAYLAKRAE